jgi:pyruvate-formate lyase-activating enzyme
VVDTTGVCNLKCTHCPHPRILASKPSGGSLHLTPELSARAVEEVWAHRQITQYMRYSANGEPLANPDLFEMLGHAVRRSGVTVTLTTNGTLLDARRAQRLLETGLHVVDVSLDALTPETYALLRPGASLEVTRANVLRLLELKVASRSRTRILVSYVERPENAHETASFQAFWRNSAVDGVLVRPLHSAAGVLREVAERLSGRDAATVRRPCPYAWERITLGPGGELLFCPQDWVHGSVVADYRVSTIAEVWQGEFYRALRAAHLSGRLESHQLCAGCPDWSLTCWPNQGPSYADVVRQLTQPDVRTG